MQVCEVTCGTAPEAAIKELLPTTPETDRIRTVPHNPF